MINISRIGATLALLVLPNIAFAAEQPDALKVPLTLRTRIQPFHAEEAWVPVRLDEKIVPSQTAIIITDMWNEHWCHGATERVGEIAKIMEPVLEEARKRGILIVHSPSGTMSFYANTQERLTAEKAPASALPSPIRFKDDAPLPFDDTDGGCDTPGDKFHRPWKREISSLSVRPGDVVSDSGPEIYNVFRQRHIKTVLYMGVHANKCILNRTFGMRQMEKWGLRCILIRDLTDAMYNPAMRPYVSHSAGVELMVNYIEQYLAPTALSSDLLKTLRSGTWSAGSTKP